MDDAVTTASVIGITWADGPSTGGSPIIDYRVSFDQSISTWVVLETGVLTKSYQTDVTLTPGATYSFRVEARNSVGYSLVSSSVQVLAAQAPDAPTGVTTTTNGGDIIVHWQKPYNGGTPITGYRVKWRQSDEVTFTESVALCDQQNDLALECTADNYLLYEAPFNLPWGTSVYAKVLAINARGESQLSQEGNGALLLRAPDAPVLIEVPELTTSTEIGFSWTDGTWDGGSPVLDWKIYKSVDGGQFEVLETGLTVRDYVAIQLTPGSTYTFQVQARNLIGYGDLSNELVVLAAETPVTPLAPTTTFERDSVRIDW